MKIEWSKIERVEPLVATVANMRACAGKPGVFMLACDGGEYSATADDYFTLSEDEVIETEGEPNILVQRKSYLTHPISGEVI